VKLPGPHASSPACARAGWYSDAADALQLQQRRSRIAGSLGGQLTCRLCVTCPNVRQRNVCTEVPLFTVVARLEALLPGLSASAAASGQQSRMRHLAYWSKLRPDRPLKEPDQPNPGYALDVEHLLAYAKKHGGRVAAQQFGDDVEFEDLAPYLRILASEPLLVVNDALECTQTTADAIFASESVRLVDGDVVIVGTLSARVVIVHHEGWIFDLDLTRP
jgi:hypothetical protein